MADMKQATVIMQARMGSSRLPGKVLKEVLGRPVLDYLLERLRLTQRVDRVILATSAAPKDEPLEAWARERGVDCVRGSENDVLDRYRQAAEAHSVRHIIRITGDCPLLEPMVINTLVEAYFAQGADYVHTTPGFCEGVDCEVFSREALEAAWKEARLASEREHVTQFFHNNKARFSIVAVENESDDSRYRFTVDEPEDFEVVKALIEALQGTREPYFNVNDIKAYLDGHPELVALNSEIIRNEGLLKSLKEDRIVKP